MKIACEEDGTAEQMFPVHRNETGDTEVEVFRKW